jgi:multiple antibiotic resistance protein
MKQLQENLSSSAVSLLLIVASAASAIAQTATPVNDVSAVRTLPGSVAGANALLLAHSQIFTFFFVMLGPLKLVAPFTKLTRGMEVSASRRLALKGVGIACLTGLVAAFVGQSLLVKWGVSLPALLLAGGLVLLLIALQGVLSQYVSGPAEHRDPEAPAPKGFALAFPNIITPYGTAALILLLAASEGGRDFSIFGIFLAVMLLNLLTMWFARPIPKYGWVFFRYWVQSLSASDRARNSNVRDGRTHVGVLSMSLGYVISTHLRPQASIALHTWHATAKFEPIGL